MEQVTTLSDLRRLPSYVRAALGEALRGDPSKMHRASVRALERRGLLLVSNGRIQGVPEAVQRLYMEYLKGEAAGAAPSTPARDDGKRRLRHNP